MLIDVAEGQILLLLTHFVMILSVDLFASLMYDALADLIFIYFFLSQIYFK